MVALALGTLWRNFPDHRQYKTLETLYQHFGGNAVANIVSFGSNGNTCASRMSAALNASGAAITVQRAQAVPAATIGTAAGTRIIYRVVDLRAYLLRYLGRPIVDTVTPYNDAFAGKPGIVAFRVNWPDATGHIALWNGTSFREPVYDDYSAYVNSREAAIKTTRGELWQLPL